MVYKCGLPKIQPWQGVEFKYCPNTGDLCLLYFCFLLYPYIRLELFEKSYLNFRYLQLFIHNRVFFSERHLCTDLSTLILKMWNLSTQVKNPQFLPNPYETWRKYSPHEVIIFPKFHKNWAKIVDFLLWHSDFRIAFFIKLWL